MTYEPDLVSSLETINATLDELSSTNAHLQANGGKINADAERIAALHQSMIETHAVFSNLRQKLVHLLRNDASVCDPRRVQMKYTETTLAGGGVIMTLNDRDFFDALPVLACRTCLHDACRIAPLFRERYRYLCPSCAGSFRHTKASV